MTAILSREDLVKSPERARSHVVILGGRGEQGGVPAGRRQWTLGAAHERAA